MDPLLKSVQEYIKSGEYFTDVRKWYEFKYLYPLSQRSLLLVCCCTLIILFSEVLLSIKMLLPIVTPVRYSIYSKDVYQTAATIIRASQIENNALKSISDLMVRNYVKHREEYDYANLKGQFTYIQNNSTRIVFRQFFNYMDIDNTLSPVMRYQKYIRRSINIIAADYPADGEAIITFASIAKSSSGEIFENMIWQAAISYEIDHIKLNLPQGSKFNFAVTSYRLKLLKNKTNK